MTEVAAMIQKSTKAAGFLAVLFLFLFVGCTAPKSSRPLLWYGDQSFSLEMTIPAGEKGEPITLRGTRTPDSIRLTVSTPERIRGLTVDYTGGNCVLSAGETVIPLSKSAAQGLTCLLDGLLLSSADGARLGSNEDGFTTVTFDSVILTLDENGLPKGILSTETGRTAELSVQWDESANQKTQENSTKDQQNNEHQNENNGGDF